MDIPPVVRREVLERDRGICRVCGSHTGEQGALHHVVYRSEGGAHLASNLVTVHWMFAPRCHELVHQNKRLWQPILLEVVKHDGLTAFQVRRWTVRANGRSHRPVSVSALEPGE